MVFRPVVPRVGRLFRRVVLAELVHKYDFSLVISALVESEEK